MKDIYKKIEVNEAAANLGVDTSIMDRLVKKFLYSDALEKTEKAFEKADIEEVKSSLHAIKGTAGNIGMVGLSQLALDMETKVKTNGNLDCELLNVMREVWNELKDERRE